MPPRPTERILFVDDDANMVASVVRWFRQQFDIVPAGGPKEGLGLLEAEGPFAVVVSDLKMPGMDGIQFLAKVRELSPDSVRIMLTGHADLDASIEAVNEGQIFRFLTKPCPYGALSKTLGTAIEQYRLITAERDLLHRTLRGSVKVLTDILALANPAAFGRAVRARERARQLAAHLGVLEIWQVELAAMLSPVGCVTMPPEIMDKVHAGKGLSAAEAQLFEKHPMIGHDLIARIPRLEKVAEIVAYQEKWYNGLGVPDDEVAGEQIPLGARILKLVLDFDGLESRGVQKPHALKQLAAHANRYDPKVLAAFTELVGAEAEAETHSLWISDLEAGMITVDTVRTYTGVTVLARGQQITEPLLARLKHLARVGHIDEPIRVHVGKGMPAPEATSSPAPATT
jgi:response regulator RpfG family c-di-GMP phosphodiesterase